MDHNLAQPGDRLIVGYDVNGFSRAVDEARHAFGKSAGEAAAAALAAGRKVFLQEVEALDFSILESCGDGLLLQRSPIAAQELDRLSGALEQAAHQHYAVSGLSVRTAISSGPVQTTNLDGLFPHQDVFHWGRALARLHGDLSRATRQGESRLTLPTRREGLLLDVKSSISQERVLVIRLASAKDWQTTTEAQLQSALASCVQWSVGMGGRPERLSHDEKGILLRLHLPRDRPFNADDIRALLGNLASLGLHCSAAVSDGPIYCSVASDIRHVHGQAINWAAKSAASARHGQLLVGTIRASTDIQPSREADFVGREDELAVIVACLQENDGALIALSGDVGIGKSRLAAQALKACAIGNCCAASVRCLAESQFAPFGAVRSILSQLVKAALQGKSAGHLERWTVDVMKDAALSSEWLADCIWLLASSPEPLRPLADAKALIRVATQRQFILGCFRRLAMRNSIVAFVDDAEFVDPYSAAALAEVLERGIPLKVMLTVRTLASHHEWLRLANCAWATHLPITGLARPDIQKIVAAHAPDLAAPLIEEVVLLAQGNPMVAELASTVAGNHALSEHQSILDLVAVRVRNMDENSRMVMRILALASSGIPKTQLEAILERLDHNVEPMPLVTQLINLSMVRFEGASLWLHHTLLPEAVKSDMSEGAIVRTAEAIAYVMWRDTDPAGVGSEHWAALADLWEKAQYPGRAAITFARAGELAMRTGFSQIAAALFSRAVTRATNMSGTRYALASCWMSRLAEAHWAAGSLSAASDGSRDAIAVLKGAKSAPRIQEARARAAAIMSETAYFQGDLRGILRGGGLATGMKVAGSKAELARCRSYSTIGYMAGICRVPIVTKYLFSKARKASSVHADSRPDAYASTTEGILNLIHCNWDECDRWLSHARSCLGAWPEEQQLSEVIETTRGHSAMFQGNFQQARHHFQTLYDAANARGNRLHMAWATYMIAQIAMSTEDLDSAEDHIRDAKALLVQLGDRLSDHIVLGLEARLSWQRMDGERALSLARSLAGLNSSIAPTNFSSLEGFAAAPMVLSYAAFKSEGRDAALLGEAKRAAQPLRRFALLFPHARPRLATISSLLDAARGKTTHGVAFNRSATGALKKGMNGEAQLAERLFA